jgi:NAD(P)-dependent dehydrogenase (short-subunit alcohol dehydrogenase family)
MLLRDKRCLIVGGTSGIGRAAARRFLAEGATVVVAGIDDAQGAETVAELSATKRICFIRCDATVSGEVEALCRDSVSWLGGLDVLYHVAGASGRRHGDGPLHECTDDGWRFTLDANLTSTFLTNRAALRWFVSRGQPGAILNLASALVLAPAPRHFDTAAYTAAKGGVIALSRLAAARYAADGIRVNVLAPGLIDTPMAARAVGDPEVRAFLRTKQPLAGGPGQPEDLAGAAAFLCSDDARFITGAVLPAEGGWCVSDGQYS